MAAANPARVSAKIATIGNEMTIHLGSATPQAASRFVLRSRWSPHELDVHWLLQWQRSDAPW
jgi:hypothetical protein